MAVSTSRNTSKGGVVVRTAFQQPDGSYRVVREERLIDDPKKGVRDLTKWKRKYASFEGRHVSRVVRPDNYKPNEKPLTEQAFRKRLMAKYGHLLVESRIREADDIYEELLHRVLIPFVADRVYVGRLSAEFQDEALEVARDAMRRAIANYDPAHPPKERERDEDEPLHGASLKTFLATCARNAIVDFIKWTNSDRVGGWTVKAPITNRGREEAAERGEISTEVIPAEAKYNTRTLELCVDCAVVRNLIARIHGRKHLEVFDKLLQEFSDIEIYQPMGITWRVFRTQYLRPIQRLVDYYWLQPSIPELEWK